MLSIAGWREGWQAGRQADAHLNLYALAVLGRLSRHAGLGAHVVVIVGVDGRSSHRLGGSDLHEVDEQHLVGRFDSIVCRRIPRGRTNGRASDPKAPQGAQRGHGVDLKRVQGCDAMVGYTELSACSPRKKVTKGGHDRQSALWTKTRRWDYAGRRGATYYTRVRCECPGRSFCAPLRSARPLPCFFI